MNLQLMLSSWLSLVLPRGLFFSGTPTEVSVFVVYVKMLSDTKVAYCWVIQEK